MTTPASSPAGLPTASPQAPTVVVAAVITTWFAAGATALVCTVLTAMVLWLGGPVADAFGLHLWWLWVLVVEAAAVACCACAALLAIGVLRGSNAARWGLIVTSAITAVICAMAVFFVWTGVVALAAFVVFALLLLPGAARWTRSARQ